MPLPPAYRGLVWLWGSFLAAAGVRGQDALFSSAALDQFTTANNTILSVQPHLGPVQLASGLYGGITYNDDINSSESHPESDEISRFGTSFSLSWAPTGNSQLQLGTSIGYVDYQKYSANSGFDVSPNSALTYAITLNDATFTVFDQFSYTREVQNQAAVANVVTLPQLGNDIGLRTEWDPGQCSLVASYSHDDNVSNHADDYLNRSSEYLDGQVGWRFAEATQVGLEVSDAFTYYQVSTANNNENLSVGGYLDWAIEPSVNLTLRGGPLFYSPLSGTSGGGANIDSYYVSLKASQQLTDFLSHSLDIERSLQAGLNQGAGYNEQLLVSYSINWMLTQRITLGASASYTDGTQPLVQAFSSNPTYLYEVDEDYQQYGGGLQASWRFTDHSTASLAYNHWLRRSNLAGRDYSDNTVSLQLSYSF
jgi:hypothetical protein